MKNFRTAVLAFCAIAVFASCKKDSSGTTDADELTVNSDLAKGAAVGESLFSDDNDVLMGVSGEEGLQGGKLTNGDPTNNFGCATVTVTPLQGFPKNVVVDFGTGCTNQNGITRSGQILIRISDSLRRPGATATTTFNNYFVNGFRRGGKITWTNTNTPTQVSWRRQVDTAKITAPGGAFWIHNGTKDIVLTAGANTPRNPVDDVFSITGSGNTTNPAGITRSHTILLPLVKAFVCPWVGQGQLKLQGPNHYVVIDYGSGTCDRNATAAVDGGTPVAITLH